MDQDNHHPNSSSRNANAFIFDGSLQAGSFPLFVLKQKVEQKVQGKTNAPLFCRLTHNSPSLLATNLHYLHNLTYMITVLTTGCLMFFFLAANEVRYCRRYIPLSLLYSITIHQSTTE